MSWGGGNIFEHNKQKLKNIQIRLEVTFPCDVVHVLKGNLVFLANQVIHLCVIPVIIVGEVFYIDNVVVSSVVFETFNSLDCVVNIVADAA